MLDIHTHILPGMDDGSKDVSESCEMLALEAQQGIRTVVLTPHFYPDHESPEEFLSRRGQAMDALNRELEHIRHVPDLLTGAEVAFFRGISRANDMDRLCIGRSNALLVEMPFSTWNDHMLNELFRLREHMGLQPVIAHVERYLSLQPRGMIQELCERGMLIQANAGFFLERSTARISMRMLKKQQIHLLGSDCHNLGSRKPNLGAAIERIKEKLGESALDYLQYMQDLVLEEQR